MAVAALNDLKIQLSSLEYSGEILFISVNFYLVLFLIPAFLDVLILKKIYLSNLVFKSFEQKSLYTYSN